MYSELDLASPVKNYLDQQPRFKKINRPSALADLGIDTPHDESKASLFLKQWTYRSARKDKPHVITIWCEEIDVLTDGRWQFKVELNPVPTAISLHQEQTRIRTALLRDAKEQELAALLLTNKESMTSIKTAHQEHVIADTCLWKVLSFDDHGSGLAVLERLNSSDDSIEAPEKEKYDSLFGFPDAETRKKIEKKAEEEVTKLFNNDYDVINVAAENKGWDLECFDRHTKEIQLYVEVKGSTRPEPAFFLTRNERNKAEINKDKWKLAMVTNVLEHPQIIVYSVDEMLETFTLEPMAYEAKLKGR